MSKRILVARAADAANLNAQAKNAQNILRRWRSTEYRPSVLAFGEPDAGIAANPNVDLIRLRPDRWWRAVLFALYLRRWDGVFYPGLHHRADWLALKARRALGRSVPIVTTIEGLIGSVAHDRAEAFFEAQAGHKVYAGKLPAAELKRYNDLSAMSDRIIAISPFLARMARAQFGDKVEMLPLGVDLRLFETRAPATNARPRVIGAGTVYARKRPEMFVRLAAQFRDADFAWFGDGDLRAGILAEIAREGLDNLQFLPPVPPERLAEEMAKSDILVLPSFAEGVPKVTQEAAAAGLAQIVYGFYEAPTVADGVNGFVVWNDEELRDRLSQLLADRDLTRRFGDAGRRMAQAWSWDVVAPQWEAAIIAACAAR